METSIHLYHWYTQRKAKEKSREVYKVLSLINCCPHQWLILHRPQNDQFFGGANKVGALNFSVSYACGTVVSGKTLRGEEMAQKNDFKC